MIHSFIIAVAFASSGFAPNDSPPRVPAAVRPKLVVLIVIDQFPAYMLPKLEPQLAPRGFRLLMEHGAWFEQAHYPQAATLTGVGHATIATGGTPAGHGIAGNDWFDRAADREVYCVEDREHRWVGGTNKPEDGTSPKNLTSTTFSDEWRLANAFEPRVVGISLKERSAILLAGKFGQAYWYDPPQGTFVSSSYYFRDDKLPAWVEKFNAAKPADKHFHHTWDLLLPRDQYHAAADDRAYEIDVPGLGRTFPHKLGAGFAKPDASFNRMIQITPQSNQFTLDFARAAIHAEQLGRRDTTDMLLVSLTATDYCGHVFGCESLEYHDIVLQTDRQLESFFTDVDQLVGLDRTLIVLTSDHGAAPSPEYVAENGLPVGRLDPDEIARVADLALDRAFGGDDWSAMFLNPGLFLREAAMKRHKIAPRDAERVAADAIRRMPGVAAVFTRTQLATGDLPRTELARAAAATFHPDRSPDVVIIQQPYWYLYKEMHKNAGMHGSPYPYDTHVPLLFFGPGMRATRDPRRVFITGVAPTISGYLGAPAPSANEGEPLWGAMQSERTTRSNGK